MGQAWAFRKLKSIVLKPISICGGGPRSGIGLPNNSVHW